jgi:hypothetical protein
MKRMIVLVVIAAVGIAATMAEAGEKAYVDAAGDAGTAPDLTNVTVTDSNGLLVFKIDGTLVPSSAFEIYIDKDRDQSTGDDGDELSLVVFMEGDGKAYYDADRWNGSKWENVAFHVTSQTFSGREEIGFKAADAGLTGTFDFVLRSVKMVADAVEGRDRAPDSIVPWSYTLSSSSAAGSTPGGTTRVVLGTPTLSPAKPVAGKPVTLRVPVRSASGGAPLTTGTATCTAQVRGRTIRGRGSMASGSATCRLVVPNGSSKATARGSITVGSGANAVTRAFSFRIA